MNTTVRIGLLSLAIVTAAPVAADSQPGQSVLIQTPKSDGYEHLTTVPAEPTLGDRCVEMAREIESLKGKPQRRAALAARYQQECELK